MILKSGFNVFCEKPLAENYSDAKDMVNAAVQSKKINMVNFTYRESSAYQKLVEILKSGEIGDPRHVSACYYQSWLTSNKWGDWREENKWLWRLSTKHGSNLEKRLTYFPSSARLVAETHVYQTYYDKIIY